jgi:hypothetical protein
MTISRQVKRVIDLQTNKTKTNKNVTTTPISIQNAV